MLSTPLVWRMRVLGCMNSLARFSSFFLGSWVASLGASAAFLENDVINALGTLDYCASSMSVTLFVVITIFFRSVFLCKHHLPA